MSDSVDVLVIGAGPAGSATARHLAQQGFRVLAVDRAVFPRDKACSEYMGPETVRLLDGLGVVADLEAAGAQPLFGTTVVGARGARLTGLFSQAGIPPFRASGLSVARRVLDHRLVQAARAEGVEVAEGVAAEQLIYDEGAVAGAVLRDPEGGQRSVRARLTVGADGLNSVVARRIGRRHHGPPRRIAFVAHLADVPGLNGVAEMHVGAEGYVGLNPIGPAVANVALVVPRSAAAGARGRVREYFFDRVRRFPGIGSRVQPSRLVREVMVTGPFAAWSGRVTVDGALLVGDAADFFDPFTGEGIYSALRGAELAADAITMALHAGRGKRRARLAEYSKARRRAFGGKWAVERLIGYGMLAPALFDHAVARLGHRPEMAHTLIGVTGDFVPARAVLNPFFLARMVI